jgi:hypothetical protein
MPDDPEDEAAEVARALRGPPRLAKALRLGRLVLDDSSGRSLRGAAKSMQLAPSTLQRYVAIAQLCRRLGRDGFDHLGVSHLKLVLSVPEPQQSALVALADAERWTVARLRRALEGTGRSRVASTAERLVAWVASPRRREEVERVEDPEALAAMLAQVRALRVDLEWLEERLTVSQPGGSAPQS